MLSQMERCSDVTGLCLHWTLLMHMFVFDLQNRSKCFGTENAIFTEWVTSLPHSETRIAWKRKLTKRLLLL